jgi:hypothetical protein
MHADKNRLRVNKCFVVYTNPSLFADKESYEENHLSNSFMARTFCFDSGSGASIQRIFVFIAEYGRRRSEMEWIRSNLMPKQAKLF